MKRLPEWVRYFIVDFTETLVPGLLVFNFVQPSDALVPALVTAIAAAGMSAARRNLGRFYRWWRDVNGVGVGE